MQRPLVDGPGFQYGLGWFLTSAGRRSAVEHIGSVAGYQSLLLLVPEESVAFAALSNSSRGAAPIRDVRRRLDLAQAAPPDVGLGDLAPFAGRYRGQGIEIEIEPENGRLRVELTAVDPFSGAAQIYPPVRARPIGEREFEIVDGEWHGDRFDFPRDALLCMGSLAMRVE
jgi:Beta-lactamase